MLSSKQTPKPARMREENCSPLNIVSDCSRTKAIRSTGIQRFKSPCNGSNLCQAGHAAFSMSSEVGRNICAPQRWRLTTRGSLSQ